MHAYTPQPVGAQSRIMKENTAPRAKEALAQSGVSAKLRVRGMAGGGGGSKVISRRNLQYLHLGFRLRCFRAALIFQALHPQPTLLSQASPKP